MPGKKQRSIQDYVYSLSIEDDDLLPTNMNYLFLSTNTVKHFTFDEKGNFKHYSYELKTDSSVDFIHNTDNIIGKIPALYKLNDFWVDNYKSISTSDFELIVSVIHTMPLKHQVQSNIPRFYKILINHAAIFCV